MNNLLEILLKKQQELTDIIECTTLSTKNAPKGFLRIAHSNDTIQYYHKTKENNEICKSGQYIRKGNRKLAYDLAQRDYDLSVLAVAKQHLYLIKRFLTNYHPDEIEEVYEKMNPYRKAIVTPRII